MKPRLQRVPREKALADVYVRMRGKKVETMSEADFRAWAAAGPVRDLAVGDTKPKTLKTIVNPVRLMEALRKSAD